VISTLSVTTSATNAFEKKMAVISDNIANSFTEGFKKSRADIKEGKTGAVEVDINMVDTPGTIVFVRENNGILQIGMSNVDIAEEIPQFILTQTGFEANIKMLKTEDEMIGTLLDMFG